MKTQSLLTRVGTLHFMIEGICLTCCRNIYLQPALPINGPESVSIKAEYMKSPFCGPAYEQNLLLATSLTSASAVYQLGRTEAVLEHEFWRRTFCTSGGHLLNTELLMKTCECNPLPLFRLVFAQMAASCKALSDAVSFAGRPEVGYVYPRRTF